MKKTLLISILLFICALVSRAQENTPYGIPAEVYYLMPSFGDGMVYFRGQPPAQGKLNICALDNSLRFLDKSGKELQASDTDNIVRVQIDTVTFILYDGIFLRMHPLDGNMGVAVRRMVRVRKDTKEVGFGSKSQTSAVKEYSSVYADGVLYSLEEGKTYPYDVSEELYLYKGDTVLPLSKRNLKKQFPEKKDTIEAYFKAGNRLPDTLDALTALLSSW